MHTRTKNVQTVMLNITRDQIQAANSRYMIVIKTTNPERMKTRIHQDTDFGLGGNIPWKDVTFHQGVNG